MSNAMTVFRSELDRMTPELARVLPPHLTVQRLARTIESTVAADPGLLECDRSSVWKAAMTAAVFGLECDGHQAAIIRFQKKAQLIPMVSGLICLAQNAGYIIDAAVVREKDAFHYQRGTAPVIHHEPSRTQDRGEANPVVAAYAYAFPLGHRTDYIFEVLELPEIIGRRDRSSGWTAFRNGRIKSTPWASDFPAMARKSAIRALANHLPWQVQKPVELETRADQGEFVSARKGNDGGIILDVEAQDVTAEE